MILIKKESKDVISQKKMEGLLKLAEIIQWGRRQPVEFTKLIMGIE